MLGAHVTRDVPLCLPQGPASSSWAVEQLYSAVRLQAATPTAKLAAARWLAANAFFDAPAAKPKAKDKVSSRSAPAAEGWVFCLGF